MATDPCCRALFVLRVGAVGAVRHFLGDGRRANAFFVRGTKGKQGETEMHRGPCRGGCGRPRGNVPCRHGAGAGADADGAAEGGAGAAARSPCGTPAHRTAPLAATQNCGGCERGAVSGDRGDRGERREGGREETAQRGMSGNFPPAYYFWQGVRRGMPLWAPDAARTIARLFAVPRASPQWVWQSRDGWVSGVPEGKLLAVAVRDVRHGPHGVVCYGYGKAKLTRFWKVPLGMFVDVVFLACARCSSLCSTPLCVIWERPVAVPDKLRPAAAICQFVPWRSACSCGGLAKWCCFCGLLLVSSCCFRVGCFCGPVCTPGGKHASTVVEARSGLV